MPATARAAEESAKVCTLRGVPFLEGAATVLPGRHVLEKFPQVIRDPIRADSLIALMTELLPVDQTSGYPVYRVVKKGGVSGHCKNLIFATLAPPKVPTFAVSDFYPFADFGLARRGVSKRSART